MDNNPKMKKSTKYLLIGTLVLFLSVIGASVAYYLARVSGNLSGRAAGTDLDLTITKLSTSANDDLIPLDNDLETLGQAILGYGNTGSFNASKACIDINGYSVCQVYKVTVTNNGSVPLDITGGVQLVGANTPNIDCAVMNTDSTITSNNTCKGKDTLANNVTLTAGASEDYYVLVYINNLDEPQYDKGGFIGTVSFTSTQGKRVKARFNPTYNAASFIKDKFDNATTKTNVDAADGVQYKYATSEFLMYDRLGGTTSNIEEGNLRYYGANPNNYIDIGDRDAKPWNKWSMFQGMFNTSQECYQTADCETNYAMIGQLIGQNFTSAAQCNAAMPTILQNAGVSSIDEICSEQPILYRIIGVFDGNLKVIRNDRIGNYSWDTSDSNTNQGYGINEWSRADLMKLLNPGYDNNQDLDTNGDTITVNNSLWYNSQSGTCYNGQSNATTSCDFTTTGLSDETKDLIVDNLWYLGGINWNTDRESFAKAWYAYERGTNTFDSNTPCYGNSNCNDNITRTTKWTGKVGLPYPSDYGYATDLSSCTENLYNYNSSSNCTDNDWLKPDNYYWTMSPASSLAYDVWYVNSGGYVYYGTARNYNGVRPVLYLKSDAVIESGTGTKSDPYVAG